TMQQDVPVGGGSLGLDDRRFDADGHVGNLRGSGRWVVGRLMGGDEDRYPVVVVAVPASGKVERTTSDEDGSGGHQLVEDLAAGAGRPERPRVVAAAVGQPGVQPLSVET